MLNEVSVSNPVVVQWSGGRYKSLVHFGLPECSSDCDELRSLSHPVEPGKLLYCFPCEFGDFIDLVTWAGVGKCDSAVLSMQRLMTAVSELRLLTTSTG